MLNLLSSSGTGNFIRFSPQANAWTNNQGEEINLGKVVFDIHATQTGWLLLGVGVRDWQPDATLGKKGAQPTPEHKRGFIVTFYNKELGTVEWSSNGVGPNMGLEQLYSACAADLAANPNKLPVLEYKGSKLEKIGKGITRIPQFDLVAWVARPAGMDAEAAPVVQPEPKPVPVAAAPKAAPAKAKATTIDDDDLF